MEEFIRLGHIVIGCGRLEKEIAKLQKQFLAPNNFAVVDVSAVEQVAAWAMRILQSYAALINRNAPLWQVPAQEFSYVIDVNIKGVATVIRHFARRHGRSRDSRNRSRRNCRRAWPPCRSMVDHALGQPVGSNPEAGGNHQPSVRIKVLKAGKTSFSNRMCLYL
jgi:NAD(P)-dependent dehydrogenase (short-subunit alcohol dehydrogenase family)